MITQITRKKAGLKQYFVLFYLYLLKNLRKAVDIGATHGHLRQWNFQGERSKNDLYRHRCLR